jgi:translation elongation factor EF-1alpha
MFFMEGKQIGVVSNYFDHVGVAAIKLTAGLKLGDTIRIVGGDSDFTDVISSIQIQHEKVEKAKKGDEIGVKISEKARKDYKVFKVK